MSIRQELSTTHFMDFRMIMLSGFILKRLYIPCQLFRMQYNDLYVEHYFSILRTTGYRNSIHLHKPVDGFLKTTSSYLVCASNPPLMAHSCIESLTTSKYSTLNGSHSLTRNPGLVSVEPLQRKYLYK